MINYYEILLKLKKKWKSEALQFQKKNNPLMDLGNQYSRQI